jgi:hypothetical protein
MGLPRVYVETSIPSIYCSTRADQVSLVRKGWTQHRWDFKRQAYDVLASEAVIEELEPGDYPTKSDALLLLRDVPLLAMEPAISEIAKTYVRHFLMPAEPLGDALHLAFASHFKCDFLLTWNCEHLANANKFQHIRRINTMLGLFVPSIVTPLELLGETP